MVKIFNTNVINNEFGSHCYVDEGEQRSNERRRRKLIELVGIFVITGYLAGNSPGNLHVFVAGVKYMRLFHTWLNMQMWLKCCQSLTSATL